MPPTTTDRDRLAVYVTRLSREPPKAEFDEEDRLVELDLAYLYLTELPSGLTTFRFLRVLVLNNNELRALPQWIGGLTRLQMLLLNNNELRALPQGIGQLTRLQMLLLNNNWLSALPPKIGQLTQLQRLSLNNNRLSALPPEIGQLTQLQRLSLNNNELSTLPPEIGQLTQLQELWLNNTRLSALLPEIGRLTQLQELWLDNNQLSGLPPEIGQLTRLQELSLSNNQLSGLPPEIGQLAQLKVLRLGNNQLSALPVEMSQLSDVKMLTLDRNPLHTPPPEIVSRGTVAVLDFLRDRARGSVTRYEAKLLLVGEGGVGKSSLLRALQGQPFDEGLPTTHGIAVEPLRLPHPALPGQDLTLAVWDFGGQQIYHTTHQFFMTQRSLYLLVWNARGDTDQGRLDHWLRNIQVLAPDAPVLLVATHVDERPADFNFDRFRAAYPQLAGHVGVSSKSKVGIAALKELIARHAAGLPLMGQQWPTSWVRAEEALQASPEQLIPRGAYVERCAAEGVDEEVASGSLGGYLHDLGRILYFQDDYTLCNRIFLKPNWLTRAMSRVLDSARVRANQGVLEHAWLGQIWERDEEAGPYDPEHYPLFLRLMERFLISFQLEADTVHYRPARSLVPLLLPHAPPAELAPWDEVLAGQPEIRMVFRLRTFVPPGLMSWFIVLTHHYTQGLHWREGVRLVYEGHQAEAVLNPSTGELWLRARGPAPSNFFNILQHTINDRILRHFYTGLVYQRQVPCNCHVARGAAEPCGYFHDYERLVERMRQGRLEAECGEWFVMVSVPELLEGIHYTTHDQVARKLDEVVHKLDQTQTGIADLTTLSTEIRDQVVTIVQGFEDLRRNFSRLWNAEMAKLEAECPNVFVLMPGGRAGLHPKNVLGTQYTLYLLCQHPVGPHIVGGEPGYNVTLPKEWWAQTAPWLKKLLDYLRYIPKGKAFVEAYDEALYKEVEAGIKVLEASLSLAPSLEGEPPAGQPSERSPFGAVTTEGPALRGFYTFLKGLDKHERWCGLTKILTNDGNLLWLCPEHLPLYEPH